MALSELGKQIQEEMDWQAATVEQYSEIAERMTEEGNYTAADAALRNLQMQEAELDGMGKLAFRLGFRCLCETKATGLPLSYCTCTKRKKPRKRKS